MPASPEKIREVIEQYVARVAGGTTDEIVALYADDATVEDPVGTEVRTTRESTMSCEDDCRYWVERHPCIRDHPNGPASPGVSS